MTIKEAYYYVFYKIFSFAEYVSKDGWEQWKALGLISMLNMIFLSAMMVWWIVVTGRPIHFAHPLLVITPIGFLVTLTNYLFFLQNNRWLDYAKGFKMQSKSASRTGSLLVFLFILMVFASLIFAFYQLSQMDFNRV